MRASANNERPTSREIEHAPELAALAVLDATIDATVALLWALNPALADDERPYWIDQPPSQRLAERIVVLAGRLQDAIAKHRNALAREIQTMGPSDKGPNT